MIQAFADWLVYTVFGLSPESHWGSAVNFFFYDSIKITILLFFISVIMGIINAYFPIDRLRRYLTTRNSTGLNTSLPRCSVQSHRSAPARRYLCSSVL